MKILKPLTLTEGDSVPSTAHVTPDLGVVDTQDIWQVEAVGFQFTLPDRFVIRALLEPVPQGDPSAKVSLSTRGEVLAAQPLYHPDTVNHTFTYEIGHCQVQGVTLTYHSSEWSSLLPFQLGDVLYTKAFGVQNNRLLHEERQEQAPRMLYGYGGVYVDGLPLEEIQQVYCELFEGIQRTEITLTSHAHWLERGVVPHRGGVFQGQQVLVEDRLTYEHSLNLGAALAEGYARFQVGGGETDQATTYQSCAAERPHNHPTALEITFEKQGESE